MSIKVESPRVTQDVLAAYGITPQIETRIKELGFAFYLPPETDWLKFSSRLCPQSSLRVAINWLTEHAQEKSLYPDVLAMTQNASGSDGNSSPNSTLIAIDFRPRPPLPEKDIEIGKQMYPDDEEYLGSIIGDLRKKRIIPGGFVRWANKEIHLPPESRFGLTGDEIVKDILPRFRERLEEELEIGLNVRLPRCYELLCLSISKGTPAEISWLKASNSGRGTGEWAQDRFRDSRFSLDPNTKIHTDPNLGFIYFGRNMEGKINIFWGFSSPDGDKKNIYTGRPQRELGAHCVIGFRPVIEFPQVIDSSQR